MTGSEMRDRRTAAGLTQPEFARLIGRSPTRVSRYERDHKPITDKVVRAMDAALAGITR